MKMIYKQDRERGIFRVRLKSQMGLSAVLLLIGAVLIVASVLNLDDLTKTEENNLRYLGELIALIGLASMLVLLGAKGRKR